MLEYFKNKARVKAINTIRKKLKRKMGFRNLNNIQTAGIVIRYQLDIKNVALNKLLDSFKLKGITAELLVYYPEKKLPENVASRDNMVLFAEGDTNWFGKPKPKEITNFASREFDLLIDLTHEHIYSLQYIIELSKASFKVGRMAYDDNPYDFVLLGDNENDSQYVDDLFAYLSKLN